VTLLSRVELEYRDGRMIGSNDYTDVADGLLFTRDTFGEG